MLVWEHNVKNRSVELNFCKNEEKIYIADIFKYKKGVLVGFNYLNRTSKKCESKKLHEAKKEIETWIKSYLNEEIKKHEDELYVIKKFVEGI